MGDNLFPLVFLVIIGAAFWLLVLRPAKARAKAQQAVVDSVRPGARVLLTSGVYGTAVERSGEDVLVEVAPGVVLTVVEQAILRVVDPAPAGTPAAAQSSEPAADPPAGD